MSDHTTRSSSLLTLKRSSVCCRICQDGRSIEDLITPCKCAGTMGHVHSTCLEKWLSRTARTFCELCNHNFKTVVERSSLREWIHCLLGSSMNTIDRRYLMIDTSCFLLLTPLGFISSYLCIQGASAYYNNNKFWTGFGLILLTGFLFMMYVLWIIVTFRYHYLMFRRWQMEHTSVRLVFSNHKQLQDHQQHQKQQQQQRNRENSGRVGDSNSCCYCCLGLNGHQQQQQQQQSQHQEDHRNADINNRVDNNTTNCVEEPNGINNSRVSTYKVTTKSCCCVELGLQQQSHVAVAAGVGRQHPPQLTPSSVSPANTPSVEIVMSVLKNETVVGGGEQNV